MKTKYKIRVPVAPPQKTFKSKKDYDRAENEEVISEEILDCEELFEDSYYSNEFIE